MQEILNLLTENNIDYTQQGVMSGTYYIIKISNNCYIKLEYLWNKQTRVYNNVLSLVHVTTNDEFDKANKIINLIRPFLRQKETLK